MMKKTPLLTLLVILATLACISVYKGFGSQFTTNQIKLIQALFTLIGVVFVVFQLHENSQNELIKTGYLNQPEFKVTGFEKDEFPEMLPVLCDKENHCNDDHWFGLIHSERLAAKNIRICLVHESEKGKDSEEFKGRWKNVHRMSKGEDCEYKLPLYTIPLSCLDITKDRDCFYVLLEYESEYTKISFRRVYCLCYVAVDKQKDLSDNDWKGKIIFYDYSLAYAMDNYSVNFWSRISNFWSRISNFLRGNRKKEIMNPETWVNSI